MPNAAIILINGFPGVGKGSVAQELVKLLPNARYLDMHQLDLAARGLHQADLHADTLGHKLRQTILGSIRCPAPDPTHPPIYILTDTIYNSLPTRAYQDLYLSLAQDNTLPLIHLIVSCSTEANIARSSQTNQQRSSSDETDVVENRMIYEVAQFVKPGKVSVGGKRGVAAVPGLAGEYEVDTTTLSPERTASVFAECVSDSLRNEGWFFQLNRVGAKVERARKNFGPGEVPAKWA